MWALFIKHKNVLKYCARDCDLLHINFLLLLPFNPCHLSISRPLQGCLHVVQLVQISLHCPCRLWNCSPGSLFSGRLWLYCCFSATDGGGNSLPLWGCKFHFRLYCPWLAADNFSHWKKSWDTILDFNFENMGVWVCEMTTPKSIILVACNDK